MMAISYSKVFQTQSIEKSHGDILFYNELQLNGLSPNPEMNTPKLIRKLTCWTTNIY